MQKFLQMGRLVSDKQKDVHFFNKIVLGDFELGLACPKFFVGFPYCGTPSFIRDVKNRNLLLNYVLFDVGYNVLNLQNICIFIIDIFSFS